MQDNQIRMYEVSGRQCRLAAGAAASRGGGTWRQTPSLPIRALPIASAHCVNASTSRANLSDAHTILVGETAVISPGELQQQCGGVEETLNAVKCGS